MRLPAPLRSPSDQRFPGGSQGFSRENAGLSPGFSGNHPVFFPKNAKVLLVCQRSAGKTVHLCCRPPRGGRGLKYPPYCAAYHAIRSRPPRGGRGLKCHRNTPRPEEYSSPPSRGAWIEMLDPLCIKPMLWTSPPSRGAWIEIIRLDAWIKCGMSPPSRGAWIEIPCNCILDFSDTVAPLAGGVD